MREQGASLACRGVVIADNPRIVSTFIFVPLLLQLYLCSILLCMFCIFEPRELVLPWFIILCFLVHSFLSSSERRESLLFCPTRPLISANTEHSACHDAAFEV